MVIFAKEGIAMIKRIKRLLLIALCITMFPIISKAEVTVEHNDKAEVLKSLELFLGTSNGFELDKTATRAEAAAMLIRLLGVEDEAKENKYKHPFIDVPTWADYYIGYMYEKGLTTGIGNNKYGASQVVDGNTYATFMLRALGYDDKKGDFKWSNALEYSKKIGLLSEKELESITKKEFKRDELVLISYNALKTNLKNNSKTLGQKLVINFAIKPDVAFKIGIVDNDKYAVLPYVVKEKEGKKYADILYTKVEGFNMEEPFFIQGQNIIGDPFIKNIKIKKMFMTEQRKKQTFEYINTTYKIDKAKYGHDDKVNDFKDIPIQYNSITVFFDDNLDPTHYIEVPKDLEVGTHYLPIIPVEEELLNIHLNRKVEEDNFINKNKKMMKIIHNEAITIYEVKRDFGMSMVVNIDRELLPESLNEFKYVFNFGPSSDNPEDGLIEVLRYIWEYKDGVFPIHEEWLDEEDNIELGDTRSYTVIILLTEDGKPIGYMGVDSLYK